MPAISYDQIDSEVTPAPCWRFWLTFPDMPGSSVSGETLALLAQRVSGPTKEIQTEPVPYQGGVRFFPTDIRVDDLTIVLVEDIDFTIIQGIQKWIEKVIDKDGNFGLPKDYKKEFKLESLDYSGETSATWTWQDCMPTRLVGYEWDGTQSGLIVPTLTINVDKIKEVTGAN